MDSFEAIDQVFTPPRRCCYCMLACTTCIVAPHHSGELPCLTSTCTSPAMYSTSSSIVLTSTTRCRRPCTTRSDQLRLGIEFFLPFSSRCSSFLLILFSFFILYFLL